MRKTDFRSSNASRHLPAPSTTDSSGCAVTCTGTSTSWDQHVETLQHAAAAGQGDSAVQHVLNQVGWGRPDALDTDPTIDEPVR